MHIQSILDSIYKLPQSSKNKLLGFIEEVHFPKGHLLLRANRVENDIYFIKKGMVRAFTQTPNNDVTFWFGSEGFVVISMRSYVSNLPGYEDIELLEDGEFYKINTQQLRNLFDEDIHIANWGRKFAEQELIFTEERLISHQFKTAKERYHELLKQNPNLFQRVQLGYIASYLGITQVSLSRIRAEKE